LRRLEGGQSFDPVQIRRRRPAREEQGNKKIEPWVVFHLRRSSLIGAFFPRPTQREKNKKTRCDVARPGPGSRTRNPAFVQGAHCPRANCRSMGGQTTGARREKTVFSGGGKKKQNKGQKLYPRLNSGFRWVWRGRGLRGEFEGAGGGRENVKTQGGGRVLFFKNQNSGRKQHFSMLMFPSDEALNNTRLSVGGGGQDKVTGGRECRPRRRRGGGGNFLSKDRKRGGLATRGPRGRLCGTPFRADTHPPSMRTAPKVNNRGGKKGGGTTTARAWKTGPQVQGARGVAQVGGAQKHGSPPTTNTFRQEPPKRVMLAPNPV